MMPGFFRDMPPRKRGKWMACVEVYELGNRGRVLWSGEFTGLRRAYLAARLVALVYDVFGPRCDRELGIRWRVRSLETT